MPIRRFLPVLFAIILLAACRDNASNESTEPNDPVTEAPSSETAQSILDLIERHSSLSTLDELIQRSGLDSILVSEGPMTLFAPTNAAFSDLGPSTNSISDVELKQLLEYHVIQTRMQTLDVPGDMTIGTLSGEELSLHPGDNGLSIADANGNRARVVTADLNAPNGVIHVIDRVLVSGQ